MILPRFISSLALAGITCAVGLAQTATEWTIQAAKDEFTDESYILLSPKIINPEGGGQSTDGPVTDEERIATLKRQFGDSPQAERQIKMMLRANPTRFDQVVLMNRRIGSADRSFVAVLDQSYFLRPFVAIDNGTLVVGVTVAGQFLNSLKIPQHSLMAVGDVRLRIDKEVACDLDPAKNPPLHLPGSSESTSTVSPAGSLPPEMAQMAMAEATKGALYAAVSGDMADVLLDQLMAGEVVRVARKPNSLYQSLGESFTAVKSYTLGAGFRAAIQRVGLRRNPDTNKWELDPAKEKDREALMKSPL